MSIGLPGVPVELLGVPIGLSCMSAMPSGVSIRLLGCVRWDVYVPLGMSLGPLKMSIRLLGLPTGLLGVSLDP